MTTHLKSYYLIRNKNNLKRQIYRFFKTKNLQYTVPAIKNDPRVESRNFTSQFLNLGKNRIPFLCNFSQFLRLFTSILLSLRKN